MKPDNQLTEKDKAAYSAIDGFIRENGYAPSVRDLCQVLGVKSTATIQFRLKSLAEKGYIKTTAGGKRTIRLVKRVEEIPTAKLVARPWQPQDLIDDLQGIIDEECDNYLNTRRTTLCMARDYLKEYFATDNNDGRKWILVKDRLPDTTIRCIVSKYNVPFLAYWDGEKWRETNKLTVVDGVTHWMSLPQPPKGE